MRSLDLKARRVEIISILRVSDSEDLSNRKKFSPEIVEYTMVPGIVDILLKTTIIGAVKRLLLYRQDADNFLQKSVHLADPLLRLHLADVRPP